VAPRKTGGVREDLERGFRFSDERAESLAHAHTHALRNDTHFTAGKDRQP